MLEALEDVNSRVAAESEVGYNIRVVQVSPIRLVLKKIPAQGWKKQRTFISIRA